jgi:transcription elongation factor Elf1
MQPQPYEKPTCPMCGIDFVETITKQVSHKVQCQTCGEQFEVEGNPDAAIPELKRPFWTDQFRHGREESTVGNGDANLGGAMIGIVSFFGLMILAITVLSVLLDL